jgi:ATP-binding cassette subfamily F protein uup
LPGPLHRGNNLLLLDEPTNHLDICATVCSETELKHGAAGFILVTHDRRFLDAVCTSIMELFDGRILKYPGTCADYLSRRADREDAAQSSGNRRNSALRRELEWLKRGPKTRTGKDKRRKTRIVELLDPKRKETAGESPRTRDPSTEAKPLSWPFSIRPAALSMDP